ncbi:uncharacterized protein BCR38DRAFT_453186 [Pseudomassariella vexata]|uniref:tRNA-dihydrouridine(47) synthase [NAD(P)(+)] n=1 Tax=Pseudomassariella vexata TaxID=1141098 RepID=A0A1Y2D6A8_9PEZI|nr:uncharacterized protein BCR38DRAFT_453186 [Pseudomassariella vexata]ORY54829.1 hypothetical protein BCR38DRAFT_453186 [Pseudomassariella vexata]
MTANGPAEAAAVSATASGSDGAVKRLSDSDGLSGRPIDTVDGPALKRLKTEHTDEDSIQPPSTDRRKGTAPVKAEYLIPTSDLNAQVQVDDDAAEASSHRDDPANGNPDARGDRKGKDKKGKGRAKQNGQNKERTYGHFSDEIKICNSINFSNEFSPRECKFAGRCNMCHDLRKYLSEGRRGDVESFGGKCPVFEKHGRCPAGWRCRFIKSHSKELEREDGRKEMVLEGAADDDDQRPGVVNVATNDQKWTLAKKKAKLEKSDEYIKWLNADMDLTREFYNRKKASGNDNPSEAEQTAREEMRAQFVDPPFKASEKRRLYFGRETPVLAPLTTQGNMPFRRLCVELGAQVTYSEMAMSMPLIQGQKGEWALMKAHETEISPPRFTPSSTSIVKDYDNSRDLKYGAQISGNLPWVVIKATEALTQYLPHLRVVDLNCGCPIDMVFKEGSGSALLDTPPKLERMIRGMNAVSGEVPITAKLRTGVKDGRPNATKLIERLAFGSDDQRDRLGAAGCAAVTLHGRSRQQRYTKSANWSYIAECAALIKTYNEQKSELADTIREPDANTQANNNDGKMYFVGNGDCYSHVEYFDHIDNAKVDSVMIARGAMIKPWIFEEIEKGQYLDKSATERLGYIEKFVRFGLENWGSDELGIGFTRRFLLEWLSFTCRYVPVGLLEYLPPNLNDRPPAYRGRNELETLLASSNYKDWIKISEMFLGPAHPGFKFQPKHKSNSHDMEAEG